MQWLTVEQITSLATLPAGYRLARLERADIPAVIAGLRQWFPGIEVGAGSVYLRDAFYARRVVFESEPETGARDICVMLIRQEDDLVGIFSCQRDRDTLALYGRMGAVAPGHRGQHLADAVIGLLEPLGRYLGMGLAYGMATTHIPFMQRALEKHGYMLAGITPGYDREMVQPGVVKRVFEALYVKVLVDAGELLLPDPRNLTPRTRALFDTLFRSSQCTPNGDMDGTRTLESPCHGRQSFRVRPVAGRPRAVS